MVGSVVRWCGGVGIGDCGRWRGDVVVLVLMIVVGDSTWLWFENKIKENKKKRKR